MAQTKLPVLHGPLADEPVKLDLPAGGVRLLVAHGNPFEWELLKRACSSTSRRANASGSRRMSPAGTLPIETCSYQM